MATTSSVNIVVRIVSVLAILVTIFGLFGVMTSALAPGLTGLR